MLGRDPSLDIVSTSATSDLAEEFGREVRNCIAGPEYRLLFPDTQLSEDSTARGRWNTAQGGSYYAIGAGGSLYGRGGMLGLIDDPFATWEDAQNQLQRDKFWNWYQGTFYNRIRPGGAIIAIMHRTHEDDFAGRLIRSQQHGGDQWEIVEVPAVLEDPPWPERYDRAALERIKANSSALQWSSLYLQNPMPEEGTFFRREWFWRFDPKTVILAHKYTTGDFAVTDDGGDATDIGTHGYLDEKLYLCIDGWGGQKAADVWIETLCDQFGRHKPLAFFGEQGVIRKAIEPFLIRRMRQRKTYCRLEWLSRPHDKATMARPLQAMSSMGQVGIADTDYGERVLRSLLNFPTGQVDDPVDMAALMGMAIHQAHPALTAEPEKKEPEDRYIVVGEKEVQEWRVV